ncbi:hypothetical protein TWF506_008680 [Arthrobotrys conoides]|uniref:Uncharacterized protein n=1 Tax=Arthrobotrys conoides TaxID=74498 RepID=A0AAN8NNV1_9PEZI
MILAWITHYILLVLAVVPMSRVFTLAARTPFREQALEDLRSNREVLASLRILKPWPVLVRIKAIKENLSNIDKNATSVDREACSSREYIFGRYITRLAYEGYSPPIDALGKDFKKYKRGSKCLRRDILLSILLDALATNLDSLRRFNDYQLNPSDDRERICTERSNSAQIFDGLISLLSGGDGESKQFTCTNVFVKEPVTVEEYTKEMETLRVVMVAIYNVVDAWVCKHKMTDRSATYFTLFSRTLSDSHSKAPNEGSIKTLHLLEDYPKAKYTKDIGETATTLITDLKARAVFTKNMMEVFGKTEPTQEETDKISKYCDTLEGVVPDDAPRPAKKKSNSKPKP